VLIGLSWLPAVTSNQLSTA